MSWEIDPFHSLVEFSVKHLMIATVKGRFTEVQGTIDLNLQKPETSRVKARVKTASIHTGAPSRDSHLRSADFFEAARYPYISFESTTIHLIAQNRCIMEGNLTLHGITRPIQLQVVYTGRNQDPVTGAWRIGLYANTMINRRDYNMDFDQNKAGVALVGDEVRIDVVVEAVHMG